MELNNGLKLTKIDRNTVFEALSEDIKEYSLRVARNAQIIYSQIVEKGMFDEYSDVDAKNIEHVYEIVKFFDIGYAFKDDKALFPNKTLPIFHVQKGADVFFADIKKREDFKSLQSIEKFIRRIAKEVAYYHHERWDGKGYPEGLRKEEIPLLARICSICLAFENVTYDHETKTKRSREEAIEFLTKEAGRSFDPSIVLLVIDIADMLAVQGDAYLSYEEIKQKVYEKAKAKEVKEQSDAQDENVEVKIPNETLKEVNLDNKKLAVEVKPVEERIEKPKEKKIKKTFKPIEMLFMPVYDIKTENIVYYQTKLVVNDKGFGAMMPHIYSTIAEKTGTIVQLVEIGLNQVIHFIKLADILEQKVEHVSIRLYTKIVERQASVNKIIKQVKDSGIDPCRFIFEIPETVLASANEKTMNSIRKIKDMGIKIAIAEFGFAYSSLHKLSDIEFDILKISREYILDIDSNSRSAGVVRSIIDMVKTLGAEEVCEGVDSEEQKHALQKIGCRKIQGSIIGDPKNSKDLLGF